MGPSHPGYPWRCLCFGFSQMTRTTPRRLIILHFSQRRLTDGLTFTILTSQAPTTSS